MNTLSDEEFSNLSIVEKKSYLSKIINNLSNEQVKELYEKLVNNEEKKHFDCKLK